MKKLMLGMILGGLAIAAVANAATINVLWYTGGVEVNSGTAFTTYKDGVNDLASKAPGAPGGNTWNVTFWDSGTIPVGSFNVLVVASPQGGWGTDPNYADLQTAAPGITLGNRTMVTGQDADWHYTNAPGPTAFDNPQGFLLDGINWAGSGTGLGLIILGNADAGFGLTGYNTLGGSTDNVLIPAAFASFPINTGLTSAGLSNWGTSAHETYRILDSTKWVGINLDGGSEADFVTIVTADTAGGGIGTVPEPGTYAMMGAGLIALLGLRRKIAR